MGHTLLQARWVVKSKYILYLLFASLPSRASIPAAHDIHISLCELKWNEEGGVFEVSLKIFIDDLELALEKQGVTGLRIGTPEESKIANTRIAEYLDRHFNISINGANLTSEFLGKETSEDFMAVWCYFQFTADLRRGGKCTISNDVLLDLYDDQRNIMEIRMNKIHKAFTIFEPGDHSWNYSF